MTMVDDKLKKINEFISNELWFDFQLANFDGYTLSITGGIDLSHNWMIEIIFKDVSFCLLKNEWKKHDKEPPLDILEGKKAFAFNQKYHIEIGNTLFMMNHEDLDKDGANAYIIAAKNLDFRFDK